MIPNNIQCEWSVLFLNKKDFDIWHNKCGWTDYRCTQANQRDYASHFINAQNSSQHSTIYVGPQRPPNMTKHMIKKKKKKELNNAQLQYMWDYEHKTLLS